METSYSTTFLKGPLDNLSGGVPITMSTFMSTTNNNNNTGEAPATPTRVPLLAGTTTTTSTATSISTLTSASPSLSSTIKSPAMRSNLTREHKDCDPSFYYDVVKVVGEGSMGRVAKVRKKSSLIGGSAYHDMSVESYQKVRRQNTSKPQLGFHNPNPNARDTTNCLELPVLGGLFSWCMSLERDGDGQSRRRNTPKGSSSLFLPVVDSTTSAATCGTTSEGEISSKDDTATSTSTTTVIMTPPQPQQPPTCASNNTSMRAFLEQSTVYASDRDTNILFAMKSIHLDLVSSKTLQQELLNEVEILKTLDHPHIVRVIETFESPTQQLFVVMELCDGGDLYTRDPYTEPQAATICGAIVSAVAYMHDHGVIHRDLKYENILFASNAPNAEIKLIDFGLSKRFVEQDEMTEGAGTVYTMAPEVLAGCYTKQADLWSVGVIAYMLMSSMMPFFGQTRMEVMKKVVKGNYTFTAKRWKNISDDAKEFIGQLLVLDPKLRATAEQALQSDWLTKSSSTNSKMTSHDSAHDELHPGILKAVKQSILRYTNYPKLRKVALMVLAHRSTSDEIGFLRKVFQHYDTDKNGTLDFKEFQAAVYNPAYLEEDYREIFNAVDIDGTGKIRYTEFLAASLDSVGWISEDRLAEAFDRVDHHDTGFITKENLRQLLGPEFPDEELDSIIKETESEVGQGISYVAFRNQWRYDRENFERELREQMGEANQMIGAVVIPEKSPSADLSTITYDEDSTEVEASRANFIQGKAFSVRKKQVFDASSQPKKDFSSIFGTDLTKSVVDAKMWENAGLM